MYNSGGTDLTGMSEYRNSFIVRGSGRWGGCQDVQSKLSAYGVSSYVRWDPAPPHWRFLYDTNLTIMQVEAALGHLVDRWQIRVD